MPVTTNYAHVLDCYMGTTTGTVATDRTDPTRVRFTYTVQGNTGYYDALQVYVTRQRTTGTPSDVIDVKPGDVIRCLHQFRALRDRRMRWRMRWLDAAGVLVGAVEAATPSAYGNGTTWTPNYAEFVVPNDPTIARMIPYIQSMQATTDPLGFIVGDWVDLSRAIITKNQPFPPVSVDGFFDGNTPDLPARPALEGSDFAWAGPVLISASTRTTIPALPAAERVNYARNPGTRNPVAGAGWASTGPAWFRTFVGLPAGTAIPGHPELTAAVSSSPAPGTTSELALSLTNVGNDGAPPISRYLALWMYTDAAGMFARPVSGAAWSVPLPPGVWTFVRVPGPIPALAAATVAAGKGPGGICTETDLVYATGALIAPTSGGTYFDGATPDDPPRPAIPGRGFTWAGAPDASDSLQNPLPALPVTIVPLRWEPTTDDQERGIR